MGDGEMGRDAASGTGEREGRLSRSVAMSEREV